MAGLSFNLSFTLPNVPNLGAVMNKGNLPLLHKAVAVTADATAVLWKQSVANARLWNGEKQAYIASIKVRWLNDLHCEVYSSYPNAQPIEQGRPPVDLKLMLNTSSKVRVNAKTGNRFLVVPIRHNSPGNVALAPAMPQSVYELASQMESSSVTSVGQRPTGQVMIVNPGSGMYPAAAALQPVGAKMVASANYKWGGKVTNAAMKAAGVSAKDRKLYAGMVKMDNSTPGAKSSQYLTFRTMSDKSSGWIIPARPGMNIAAKVASTMQPLAQAALSEAMKREAQKL